MEYISLAFNGLHNFQNGRSLLEFAAVIEDTESDTVIDELPSFHRYIDYGLSTRNGHLSIFLPKLSHNLKALSSLDQAIKQESSTFCTIHHLPDQFLEFLVDYDVCDNIITVALFEESDKFFLLQNNRFSFNQTNAPNINQTNAPNLHNNDWINAPAVATPTIQMRPFLVQMLFYGEISAVEDLFNFNSALGISKCKEIAGIESTEHNALDYAKLNVRLIRSQLKEKNK